MNELSVITLNGTDVADSRQVAEAVGITHNELLKRIRTYCEYLGEGKIPHTDFFIESTYTTDQNKIMPCYMITRKGCEMIANKMTGKKGVTFTALYVTAFHEMEQRQPQVSELSPMLQYLIQMEQRQNQLEQKQTELENALADTQNHIMDAAVALGPIGPVLQNRIRENVRLRTIQICRTLEVYDKVGSSVSSAIYKALQKRFEIPTYKELPIFQMQDAVSFILDWEPSGKLLDKINKATPKPDLRILSMFHEQIEDKEEIS